MARASDYDDLSELEREFEMELEQDSGEPSSYELPDEEFESEAEFESDDLSEELEFSDDAGFAERFYELSQRSFESETEIDDEVNRLMEEMEQEFFFKNAWSKLKKAGKQAIGGVLKTAVKSIPGVGALKGVTSLLRGDLRGLLGQLAKTLLSSAVPGGGLAAGPVLKALGLEVSEDSPEASREAWEAFVEVSREAYELAADNLTGPIQNPVEASRIATRAFQSALQHAPSRNRSRRRSWAAGPPAGGGGAAGTVVRKGRNIVVRLRPGQRVVVVRGD